MRAAARSPAAALVFPALLALGVVAAIGLQPRLAPTHSYEALLKPTRISITAGNLDEAVGWYEDKLGFTRLATIGKEGESHVLLSRGGNLVDIQDGKGRSGPILIESANRPTVTVSRVPLVTADLDEDYAALRERGVEILEEPRLSRRNEARIGKIRDLEGRVVILRQPMTTGSN